MGSSASLAYCRELCEAVPALSDVAGALKAEVQAYRVAARGAPAMDHSNVKAFTETVVSALILAHSRDQDARMAQGRQDHICHSTDLGSLRERVSSLLEAMFGKTSGAATQRSPNLIQGTLMLRYNKRNVG